MILSLIRLRTSQKSGVLLLFLMLKISLEVFNKALQFEKSFCKITDEEISVIMPVRKTLLFNINKPWVKKFRNKHFGVPLGCFDDAEVSEIAETNILSKIRL